MIKGKAKIEFGTGTVEILPVIRDDGVMALVLKSCEPKEIGSTRPIPEDYKLSDAQVIMAFTNVLSIKSVIENLAALWRMKNGYKPGNYDEVIGAIDLDFDNFLEDAK